MSTKDYINVANDYNIDLDSINEYIYRKEIKITRLAKAYGCSRTTLYAYLDGSVVMPHTFYIFMQHMMKSDPCN